MTNVAIIVGSLRKDSFTRKWAEVYSELFPETHTVKFVEIGDLPLYNEDIDGENPPAEYTRFREEMSDVDMVLFATPEYNRSMPASIKNALDVGSRPYGSSIWDGKPAMIVSQSVSNLSGFGANHSIRQSLVFLNMPVVQQPEVYLANSGDFFDEGGKLNNEDTRNFLKSTVDAFVDFAGKFQ